MAEQQNTPAQQQVPPQESDLRTAIQVFESKPIEIQRFELQQRSARLFAMSGLFADIKGQTLEQSIAQAFVKICLGEAMGFNPAESMTGIDLIQGRVAISANMRAARMQRAGYDWDILQLDDKGCRLQMKFQGKVLMREEINGKTGEVSLVPAVVSFTPEDATRAGLLGKDNYKKNPRNMFFARAVTNAQRWYAPGVLSANILSTEEAESLSPSTGFSETRALVDGATNRTDAVKNIVKARARGGKQASQPEADTEDDTSWNGTTTTTRGESSTSTSEEAMTEQTEQRTNGTGPQNGKTADSYF